MASRVPDRTSREGHVTSALLPQTYDPSGTTRQIAVDPKTEGCSTGTVPHSSTVSRSRGPGKVEALLCVARSLAGHPTPSRRARSVRGRKRQATPDGQVVVLMSSPKRLVWATTSPVRLRPPPDPEKGGGLNWVVGAADSTTPYSAKAAALK